MAEAGRSVALVTGASGGIGRHLCAYLRQEGWHVLGLSTRHQGAGPWHSHLTADLSDPRSEALGDRLSKEGITVVWHLAGKAHALAELGQNDDEYDRINIGGTRVALEIARRAGASRFVLASSVKAMGEGGGAEFDETGVCVPQTPYGRSKLAAERLALAAANFIEPVVLRFCMVYGSPNDRGNMGRMLGAVRRWRFPPFPETGNRRSFVHVEDAVQACWLAGTHPAAPGETFLVTGGHPCSTAALYGAMCEALGRRPPRWAIPVWLFRVLARLGDGIGKLLGRRAPLDSETLAKLLESAAYSSEKISRRLGYRPAWPLRRGLAGMARFGRSEEEWP